MNLNKINLKIALAQINLTAGAIEGNCKKIILYAKKARDEFQADIVVFPELAITGYPPEDLLYHADLYAAVENALDKISIHCNGIDVVVGHPLWKNNNLYNAASHIKDKTIIGSYCKQKLPNYGVFDEKRYFSTGNTADANPANKQQLLDCKGYKFAITICEDLWHQKPAKIAADSGAEIIFNINASPFHIDKQIEREELVYERSLDTNIPICYTNLVGGQDELIFDGGSFVTDCDGQLIARAKQFSEELVVVGNSAAKIHSQFSPIETIYRALVLGVHDYVYKNSFSGVVLGLSGGIDSALTLAIAVDAIGAENVSALIMPSRYSADMSREDAITQAQTLGVKHHTISIEPLFNGFTEQLSPLFQGAAIDTTEENIQARCRGILLMAVANKEQRILLTTSNKSETAVGYTTLYGDMAGGFAPLKDVSKSLVYELADWCNRNQQVIPQRVIDRPPSAELAPEQKDSNSLPPYSVLDKILEQYVEQNKRIAEITADCSQAEIDRIVKLVDRNEYKRQQSAPGTKITSRAFGKDWRYPISRSNVAPN